MSLTAPKLDDRHFQDLVDEAKKRIPHYTPEWTDHNVSDPGVTMIELFAWMTDILLYRLNRVPERHTIKFMEMLGITLKEPVPATAPVTFWLSAPQKNPVIIPAGTEVASTQTETTPSIIFTTDEEARVDVPALNAILSRVAAAKGKQYQTQNLRRVAAGFDGFDAFSPTPAVDDALYFGFANDLSHHILGFELTCDGAGGAGIDPTMPPVVWEASTGDKDDRWRPCVVDVDTTKGMNASGRIHIHVPEMGPYSVNNQKAYWVRVRVRDISAEERAEGMRPYRTTPRLQKIAAAAWGITTQATHARLIRDEFLGQSDGTPGQQFKLQVTPVLSRQPGQTLVVQPPNEALQVWTEVRDFADSGAFDRHFTLDGVTGEVRLGPALRQPDGTMKLYGAVPPRGANLIFKQYRTGGGQEGNVQAGILNTLKTSIPFVARVSNREPAWGGQDAESLETAVMRAPKLLRSRDRAVTASDFEFLARQTPDVNISRVKCLQPRPSEAGRVDPGKVYVLVIPRVPQPDGFLPASQLELPEDDQARLMAYLDERRLLTTRLEIVAPAYHWVAVRVSLRAEPGANETAVEADVLARLYHYLNPITGGKDGEGWPFGRDLYISDVYQCLQGLPKVQFVREVTMYAANEAGEAQGEPVERIDVRSHGVVASGLHGVEFV